MLKLNSHTWPRINYSLLSCTLNKYINRKITLPIRGTNRTSIVIIIIILHFGYIFVIVVQSLSHVQPFAATPLATYTYTHTHPYSNIYMCNVYVHMYIHVCTYAYKHTHTYSKYSVPKPKQAKNKENEKSYQVSGIQPDKLSKTGDGGSKERRPRLNEKCLSFH